jgi:hypothetical protein
MTLAALWVDPAELKMMRETLCQAESCVVRGEKHLQHLIDEIDRHRPLGPDGTHGDLHTATCGCER